MSSTSEKGHAKNVANFYTLKSRVESYPTYKPTNSLIKGGALDTLYTSADAAVKAVDPATTPLKNAENTRRSLFKPLAPLATRVVNALDSSEGVSDDTVANARTFLRKIRGERVSPPTPTDSDPAGTSASQRSYDNLVQHFNGLVSLVAGQTQYAPDEDDLKVSSLQTLSGQLQDSNKAVVDAATVYNNAIAARNSVLYDPTTGLVDVALETKKYVISMKKEGTKSSEYKQIAGIEFTRLKKSKSSKKKAPAKVATPPK